MAELGIADAACRRVEQAEADRLVGQCHSNVTTDRRRRWWWECLAEPSFGKHCRDAAGPSLVVQLLPRSSSTVYLAPSNDDHPPWPLFEVAPQVLEDLLLECPAFEYIVFDASGEWVIGENHHDVVFGSGEILAARFAEFENGR